MTPERWRRVEELYHAALTQAVGDRAAFLARQCPSDDALRREVESLLAQDGSADGFFERPPAVPDVGPSGMTGRRLGVFEVQAQIGAGGMGEVYRARDTRLGREVAIKILPRAFTSDPERLVRFEREARVLASLNHPHIGAIYGLEDAGGVPALVLELVEGETLADRIGRGPLALPDALSIARQIADALEAAHERGVVHRDLKPANVKITPDGIIKVLDFGLAKATSDDGLTADDSHSPTMAVGNTREGVILGTPAYMSPEQARGRIVDKRTDVWAFGCVLYEMLTGRATFRGDTISDTIAAVLEGQADLSSLPGSTPPGIRRLLQRCFEKDSKRRLRDIGEARVEIETTADPKAASEIERESPARSPVGSSRSRRWLWVAAPAVLVVAVGLFAWRSQMRPQTVEPLQAVPLTTLPGIERRPSFSPDGDRVAFNWDGPAQDNSDVYAQQIGSGTPLRLTNDPASDSNPSWSPDGRWIAFLRGLPEQGRTELRLVPPLGGPERKLADLHPRAELLSTLSVAWCPDSSCVVATDSTGLGKPDALFVVSLESGEKRQLTRPESVFLADIEPAISPDGNWMVFSRNKTPVGGELHVLRLGAGLVAAGEPGALNVGSLKAAGATWLPDSEAIIFAANGSLWTLAVPGPGRPSRLPFVGDDGMMPVVSRPQPGGLPRLAYVRSYVDLNLWRVETSTAGAPASSAPAVAISSTKIDFAGQFSPDGHRVAFMSARSGELEVWVADPNGSNAVQLTDLAVTPGYPRWSPDGNSIVFHADPAGHGEVLMVPAAGGKTRNLTSAPSADAFPAFSPDGHWIYFSSSRNGGGIFRFPPSGGEAAEVAGIPAQAITLSPDGAFVYYLENFSRPSALWRLPVSGGPAVKVLEGVQRSCYTVLDGGIYYIEQPDGPAGQTRLQYFNFSNSTSRTVAQNLGNVGLSLSASRDGRTILYSRYDSSVDDLMLVENFR